MNAFGDDSDRNNSVTYVFLTIYSCRSLQYEYLSCTSLHDNGLCHGFTGMAN